MPPRRPPSAALALLVVALGVALARGLDPAPPRPRGPARLAGLPARLDLGRLVAEEERVVHLPWRRAGTGTLRLLAVRTDCGCVASPVPTAPLPEGSRGTLPVTVRAPRRPGPFAVHVRVHAEAAPPDDCREIVLAGHVGTAVAARPQAVDLGRRGPDQVVERTIEVAWDPSVPVGPPATWRVGLAGIGGSGRVEPAARAATPGCVLRLALRVPRVPGPIAGEAALFAGRRCLVVVPLRGAVVAPRPEPASAGR